jgi:hypothetical protein
MVWYTVASDRKLAVGIHTAEHQLPCRQVYVPKAWSGRGACDSRPMNETHRVISTIRKLLLDRFLNVRRSQLPHADPVGQPNMPTRSQDIGS